MAQGSGRNGDKMVHSNRTVQYDVDEIPPAQITLFMALQNIILMITSALASSFIVSDVLCTGSDQPIRAVMFSTTVMLCGICTILQTTLGIRLPIFQGPSASFIAPLVSLTNLDEWKCSGDSTDQTDYNGSEPLGNHSMQAEIQDDLNVVYEKVRMIQGCLLTSSVVQVIIGMTGLLNVLIRLIGSLTITITLSMIGITVANFSIHYCRTHWGVASATALLTLIFMLYLRNTGIPLPSCKRKKKIALVKIFKDFPMLLAIIIMWIISHVLTVYEVFPSESNQLGYTGRTDAKKNIIEMSPWFYVPYPGQFGSPTFNSAVFIGFLAATLCSIVESIGDYFAAAKVCEVALPPQHALNRGILIEGVGGVLSGFMGVGYNTTSYTGHVALIGVTKVASRSVLVCGGFILILMSVIGKFGAFLATIPDPLIGGIALIVSGMLMSIGLSNLQFVDLNSIRNMTILGTSFAVGYAIPLWIGRFPDDIKTGKEELDQIVKMILGTPMFLGALTCIILDASAPGSPDELGSARSSRHGEYQDTLPHGFHEETEEHPRTDIYEFPLLKSFLTKHSAVLKYIYFLPSYANKSKVLAKNRVLLQNLDNKSEEHNGQ